MERYYQDYLHPYAGFNVIKLLGKVTYSVK